MEQTKEATMKHDEILAGLRALLKPDHLGHKLQLSTPDIDRIEAAISAIESQRWQPIESAPKDGTRVILGWPGGGIRYGYFLDNSPIGSWRGWRGPSLELPFPSAPPTHWQPLPAAPEDEKG
jgi:hypothetical protein